VPEENATMNSNPEPTPRRFTADEYRRMVEVGVLQESERLELIDGEIVAASPQSDLHASLVAELWNELVVLFPASRYSVRALSPFQADNASILEPDLVVLPGPCRDYRDKTPTSALLIVEVSVSSRRLDRGRKSQLYARAGVPEYWIIDVGANTAEVRRDPASHGYRKIELLTGNDRLVPIGLESAGGLRVGDYLPSSVEGPLELDD